MAFEITNGLCELADVKLALNITDTRDDIRISLAIDSASRLIESECDRRFWQDPLPRTDAECVLDGTAVVQDTSITAADAGRQVLDPTGNGYIQPGTVVTSPVAGVGFTLANFEGTLQPALGSGTQDLIIGLTSRYFVCEDPWLCEVDDFATIQGLVVKSDYAGDGSFSTVWEVEDYQLEPINGLWLSQPWPYTQLRAIRSLYFPVWGGISYPKPYTQALVEVTAQWGWAAIPSRVTEAAIIQAISIFRSPDAPFGATPFAETGIIRLKQALHPTAAMLIKDYCEDEVFVA